MYYVVPFHVEHEVFTHWNNKGPN